jgi:hypothetical protein
MSTVAQIITMALIAISVLARSTTLAITKAM